MPWDGDLLHGGEGKWLAPVVKARGPFVPLPFLFGNGDVYEKR